MGVDRPNESDVMEVNPAPGPGPESAERADGAEVAAAVAVRRAARPGRTTERVGK